MIEDYPRYDPKLKLSTDYRYGVHKFCTDIGINFIFTSTPTEEDVITCCNYKNNQRRRLIILCVGSYVLRIQYQKEKFYISHVFSTGEPFCEYLYLDIGKRYTDILNKIKEITDKEIKINQTNLSRLLMEQSRLNIIN